MINNLKLYLIRHGESVQNTKPEFIGQEANEPLTSEGKFQSLALGNHFFKSKIDFDHIYCSPYTRALQTSRIACERFTEKDVECVGSLREYSAGDMKGSKRSEVMNEATTQSMATLGMLFSFSNGESLYQVQERVLTWMDSALLNNASMEGKRVALFSHGMTIKCILQYVMQFNQHMTWRMRLDNTSVSVLQIKNGLWFVDSINDTKHLA